MTELALRMVASLAVVVGLLILAARLAGRKFRGSSNSLVTVLHRQALSRTSAVSVISVGSRLLVLGTTEQQVRVLAELDPTDLDETALADVPATVAAPVGDLVVPQVAGPPAAPLTAPLTAPLAAPLTDPVLTPDVAATGVPTAGDVTGSAPTTATTSTGGDVTHTDYADFAAALLSQVSAQKVATSAPSHDARLGRHRAPTPLVETPPTLPGGRRAVVRPAPTPAPLAVPAAALAPAGVTGARLESVVPTPHGASAAGTAARAAAAASAGSSALAGSVLSPQTWRQAFSALGRRVS